LRDYDRVEHSGDERAMTQDEEHFAVNLLRVG
jgi:hypothetical protein